MSLELQFESQRRRGAEKTLSPRKMQPSRSPEGLLVLPLRLCASAVRSFS